MRTLQEAQEGDASNNPVMPGEAEGINGGAQGDRDVEMSEVSLQPTHTDISTPQSGIFVDHSPASLSNPAFQTFVNNSLSRVWCQISASDNEDDSAAPSVSGEHGTESEEELGDAQSNLDVGERREDMESWDEQAVSREKREAGPRCKFCFHGDFYLPAHCLIIR